ncbi:hypothetical protein [Burkholderia gladioli]|uniref:hypothetical protein n=1 Tax=Burkholderia gladioli TaxID=28095 RepID=UPI0013F681D3|nr:hypothetical protein [Burkholderia gladioli]
MTTSTVSLVDNFMLEALNDDGWNRRFNGLQAAHFRARRCIRGAGMCGKTQLCKLVLALARAIRAGVPEVAASIPLRWRTRGHAAADGAVLRADRLRMQSNRLLKTGRETVERRSSRRVSFTSYRYADYRPGRASSMLRPFR